MQTIRQLMDFQSNLIILLVAHDDGLMQAYPIYCLLNSLRMFISFSNISSSDNSLYMFSLPFSVLALSSNVLPSSICRFTCVLSSLSLSEIEFFSVDTFIVFPSVFSIFAVSTP